MKDTKIQPTLTSRELADLIVDLMRHVNLEKALQTATPMTEELAQERRYLLMEFRDTIEMKTRKLADALKALYPPGGVAVYGKNDSPKL